jgi:hypothetical protein
MVFIELSPWDLKALHDALHPNGGESCKFLSSANKLAATMRHLDSERCSSATADDRVTRGLRFTCYRRCCSEETHRNKRPFQNKC